MDEIFSFFFFSGTAARDTPTCDDLRPGWGARFAQDRLEYFVFSIEIIFVDDRLAKREREGEWENEGYH